MLTSWKQTKTSFEGVKDGRSGGKKKAKKQVNGAKSSSDTNVLNIGVAFVQSVGNIASSVREGNNLSSNSKKKRRKQGGSSYADATSMDVEPVVCLTSQQRVTILGKAKDNNLVESKTRTYVTRPGTGAQFSLSNSSSDDAFAGMSRLGAKYDPTSNMMYAIRNNGAEVAIWTAAPSSVISGPDDKVDSKLVNGKKLDEVGASHSKKKRKADQHGVGLSPSSANTIISQSLQLPKGKIASTLTPFRMSTSTMNGTLVGASGSCKDGSIWIVIRSINGFLLSIVEGSSFHQSETDGSSRQGKSKSEKSEWKILDSRATCAIEKQGRKGSSNEGVTLKLCSVIYSEGSGRLAHRLQHVNVSAKNGDWCISNVKKSVLIDLMQLPKTKSSVAAILDISGYAITIVHQSEGEEWLLTSANVSESDETQTKSTFPLNCNSDETVFSFGNVLNNVSAILTEGKDNTALKLVDHQRGAEISSVSLNRTLLDRKCLGMFTDEMNGLIALLASSEDLGSVEVLHTTLNTGFNPQQTFEVKGTSLASTLRLVAQSSRSVNDFAEILPTLEVNANFGAIVAGNAACKDTNSKSIETVVNEACLLLVSAASSLIDADMEEEVQQTNGMRQKGRRSKKNGTRPKKWGAVYQEGRAMIVDAQRGEKCKPMKNGFKDHSSADSPLLPRPFIDVAFGQSARLMLSSNEKLSQDIPSVLLALLETKLISARETYGIDADREHLLMQLIKRIGDGSTIKLDLIGAILDNVCDIPEVLLVSILRFVVRSVNADDAATYYKNSIEHSKISRKVDNGKASMRLLSQTILKFTSKIVTNSKCNHSFLTKAMQDSFSNSVEVETILTVLSKLLQSGDMHADEDSGYGMISLSMGTIDWIAAVTDAHMGNVMKITNEGGLVIDKMQRVIRSVMLQSEFGNELKELVDYSTSALSSLNTKMVSTAELNNSVESNSIETVVMPYSFERLAF